MTSTVHVAHLAIVSCTFTLFEAVYGVPFEYNYHHRSRVHSSLSHDSFKLSEDACDDDEDDVIEYCSMVSSSSSSASTGMESLRLALGDTRGDPHDTGLDERRNFLTPR